MKEKPAFEYAARLFEPKRIHRPRAPQAAEAGDQRVAPVYVYDDRLILAVNVALASRRPLLVRGPSGCGKSSLARNVADVLRWRYYEQVITSRTEARDLLWQVDLLRRLHDAQRHALGESYAPYIQPGVLWWAFSPHTATWRGQPPGTDGITQVPDPSTGRRADRAVVLLDEIDKADPEVPNNLLVPLGSLYFEVEEINHTPVRTDETHAPLVIITTNDERDLPKAFLRRCVEVTIDWPTRSRLVEIAGAHFTRVTRKEIDEVLVALFGEAAEEHASDPIEMSPAELIDTIRAVRDLGVRCTPGSMAWEALAGMTVWKHGRTRASR
jgi:MoxR-like ATPase